MTVTAPQHLLIFISSLSSGGAERVSSTLANYWSAKGWDVTVVTLVSPASDFYELHPSVKRIALELPGESSNPVQAIANNLCRALALRRVLRELRPDLALSFMTAANVLLALAATGIKGLATVGAERVHPPMYPLGKIWETLRTHLYRRLDAVVALTFETTEWLCRHTGARRVVRIPNVAMWPLTLQPPYLQPPVRSAQQRLLLAVGRFSEQKRFDLLISAFQRLAARFPLWKLVILGDGPDRAALEAQIEAAELKHRVALPGRAGNVGQWYAAADLYVMSSRFEGFPNALAEAMAHGLPAVSFDCDTGPRDIIRHDVDGLLVTNGDVVALADTLGRLMGDEGLRQQFAVNAIDARKRFSMEKIAGMWEDLFEELRTIKQ